MGADRARQLRSSHVQVWLFAALTVVALGGGGTVLAFSDAAGLFIAPRISRLGMGTFDFVNLLFLVLWGWMLHPLTLHDGLQYQLRVGRRRVDRSLASDLAATILFTAAAVLWGVLGVHRVFTERASDPVYLDRLPDGASASALAQGATAVTIAWCVVIGLEFALVMVARLFTPADLDEYERYARRLARLPAPRASRS